MSKFNSPINKKMFIKFAQKGESHVQCMNNHYANLFLTAKLLNQGYRYHKIRKAFAKFYHRHSEFMPLGFSPNSLLCFPCPCSVGKPDACFFSWVFFS